MNEAAEKYVKKAQAVMEALPAPTPTPTGDLAPERVVVPVGEIPLRLLTFQAGHRTSELKAGPIAGLLATGSALLGLPDSVVWGWVLLGAAYILSRGMAKQRRR